MSRMATSDYMGARRRAYANADQTKRIHILDEVCETAGYERKYANRLPQGMHPPRMAGAGEASKRAGLSPALP